MKNILFLLLSILLIHTASTVVSACSCGRSPNLSEEQSIVLTFEKSDVVFSGKVLKVKVLKTSIKNPFPATETTLEVLKSWKDAKTRKIIVFTRTDYCGYEFEIGSSYLVYGYNRKNNLIEMSLCPLTKRLSLADTDLQVINQHINSEMEKN